MATLGGTSLTLAELAKRQDPDGMPARIAELLSQTNAILEDIPMMPSNLPTGHRSTIRTGLPTVSTRRLNQGVASSRSTTAQITDGIALLEAQSWTDVKLLEISGNPAATRASEGAAFIESMGQKHSELLFYGSEADDETEFNGFTVRYDSLSGNVSDNVLSAEGTPAGTDNSSIWLINWAPDKIFGIYPKGTVGGLRHRDLGEQAIQEDSSAPGGSKLIAVGDQWTWDCGLVVKDWRNAVRIANIDISVAQAFTTGSTGDQDLASFDTNIMYLMADAMHRIPSLSGGNPVFYMNRTIFSIFDRMVMASANQNVFRTNDVNGKAVMAFRGIPIKICDQLVFDEMIVS